VKNEDETNYLYASIALILITLGIVYYFNPELYFTAFDWIRDLFNWRGSGGPSGGPTGGTAGLNNLPNPPTPDSGIVNASDITLKGPSNNKFSNFSSYFIRDTADEINRQLRMEGARERAIELGNKLSREVTMERAGELGNKLASSRQTLDSEGPLASTTYSFLKEGNSIGDIKIIAK
jgi:hypothetical protein